MEPLVMFVIVRKDLIKTLGWPWGALMTQCCHAVSSSIWQYRDHENMQTYMADLPNMHKVLLEVKNESQLLALADKLEERQLKFVKWIEQPENILTCLATIPYTREEMGDVLKKAQLIRNV